jgi:3-oxoacyl-[acyl-carrier protein] reductase
MDELKGKIAVVTGASNGIGAAAAKMLAEAGATVVVGYHRGLDRARQVVSAMPGEAHRAQRIALEESSSMKQAADEVRDAYGRCDILVNSAGFTRPVPHANLDALDDALIDSVLIANVRGPFAMIRAFAPLLRDSGEAVIINVSSISSFTASGSSIAYVAAKAALDSMTMALARVLGPEIRIMCVSPGAVNTDFVAGRTYESLQKTSAQTPLRKVVEPADVARTIMGCVLYLKNTTGARIVCDNGRFLA